MWRLYCRRTFYCPKLCHTPRFPVKTNFLPVQAAWDSRFYSYDLPQVFPDITARLAQPLRAPPWQVPLKLCPELWGTPVLDCEAHQVVQWGAMLNIIWASVFQLYKISLISDTHSLSFDWSWLQSSFHMGQNPIWPSTFTISLESSLIETEQSDQLSVFPVAIYVTLIMEPTKTLTPIAGICSYASTPITRGCWDLVCILPVLIYVSGSGPWHGLGGLLMLHKYIRKLIICVTTLFLASH